MLIVWYIVFNLQGIYRSHRLSRFKEELKEIGRAVFLASLMLLTVAQIGRWQTITLWTAACVGLIGLVLIVSMRVLLRLNLRRLRLRGHNIKTLLAMSNDQPSGLPASSSAETAAGVPGTPPPHGQHTQDSERPDITPSSLNSSLNRGKFE